MGRQQKNGHITKASLYNVPPQFVCTEAERETIADSETVFWEY